MKTYYGDSFLFRVISHTLMWKGEVSQGLNLDKQSQGFLNKNNPVVAFKMKHKVIVAFCILQNKGVVPGSGGSHL